MVWTECCYYSIRGQKKVYELFWKIPYHFRGIPSFFVTSAYFQVIGTSTTSRLAAGCSFIHIHFTSKVSLFKLTATLALYYFLPLS